MTASTSTIAPGSLRKESGQAEGQPIAEAASKKRGRPPDPLLEAMRPHARSFFPHITTRRGLDEQVYAGHAQSLLIDSRESLGWLWDSEKAKTRDYRPYHSLWAELGRIPWDGNLRDVAMRLAKEKPRPTVKVAVAAVRLFRLILAGKHTTPPPENSFSPSQRVRIVELLEAFIEDATRQT